jgi:hypothetical protein
LPTFSKQCHGTEPAHAIRVRVWLAEGGSQIKISGGMTDKGMNLVGTLHELRNGSTVPFRGLWTQLPDGRLRRLFRSCL